MTYTTVCGATRLHAAAVTRQKNAHNDIHYRYAYAGTSKRSGLYRILQSSQPRSTSVVGFYLFDTLSQQAESRVFQNVEFHGLSLLLYYNPQQQSQTNLAEPRIYSFAYPERATGGEPLLLLK